MPLALAVALAVPAAGADEPFIGPYLQGLTADSAVIMWESEEKVAGEVQIGEGDDLGRTLVEPAARNIHEVVVDGLRPDTLYAYRVRWAGKTSRVCHFRSMPPGGSRRFRLAAYGDSRSNPVTHAAIARRMLAADPDLVIHTGDLVTNGTVKEQWKPQFFDPLRELAAARPVITCLGNHEKDSGLYYDYFHYPGNEAWFSYRWANVHFIVLDSEKPYAAGSEQYAWLEKELAGPDADWRIAFFHAPMFSCHPTREVGANRWAWQDLFDRHGVDLVITGHDHYYHRTHRIGRAYDAQSRGVYHITTAGGGARLYPIEDRVYSASARSVHHFMVLDIDGKRIAGSVVGLEGEMIDAFTIDRRQAETTPFVSYEMVIWEKDLREAVEKIEPEVAAGSEPRIERTFQLPAPFGAPPGAPAGAAGGGPSRITWRWVGGSAFWDGAREGVVEARPGESFEVRVAGRGRAADVHAIPELELSLAGPPGGREFINRTVRMEPLRVAVPRSIQVTRLAEPIRIDGKDDEPVWAGAAAASGFTRRSGRFLSLKEKVAVVYDDRGVTIAARADSPLEKLLERGSSERDSSRVFRNDESWLFAFTSPGLPALTFLFAGNTRGTRYDSLNGVVLWSAAWEFAAAERPGGWSAEAFIPWAALGLEGPPASAWRANFIRRDEATLEIAEWAATFSRGGDERKRDGTIAFELLASGG